MGEKGEEFFSFDGEFHFVGGIFFCWVMSMIVKRLGFCQGRGRKGYWVFCWGL